MGERTSIEPNVRFGTIGHIWERLAQNGQQVADVRVVTGRAARLYLIAGAVAVCCYLVLPGVAGTRWLFEAAGASATLAMAVGIAMNRPKPVSPWLLFLLAQLLFGVGDFCYYAFDLSFPSAA